MYAEDKRSWSGGVQLASFQICLSDIRSFSEVIGVASLRPNVGGIGSRSSFLMSASFVLLAAGEP